MFIRIAILFAMLNITMLPNSVCAEITVSNVRILQSEHLEPSALFLNVHNKDGEIVQLNLQENEFVKTISSLTQDKPNDYAVADDQSIVNNSLHNQNENLRIILFQPKKQLIAGESLPLTLNVNNNEQIHVQAKVVKNIE